MALPYLRFRCVFLSLFITLTIPGYAKLEKILLTRLVENHRILYRIAEMILRGFYDTKIVIAIVYQKGLYFTRGKLVRKSVTGRMSLPFVRKRSCFPRVEAITNEMNFIAKIAVPP